ncbi:MAG TPA: cyclic nucleotide-binding domain-containing protein [Stellaceae bacterium]|nr:cyclic nucleotide-binding domain-containing protein [Stellaceae bacterium]
MTEAQVERLLARPPLKALDASVFPPQLALEDIVLNDSRVVHCQSGDIIVREGDYGNSTFFVLDGSVGVVLGHDEAAATVGSAASSRRNIFSSLAQLWRNARVAEARDVSRYGDLSLRYEADAVRPYVRDLEALVIEARFGAGGMFGEIAALSRTPRTATCVALTECSLLELRWQGLRDIRRYDLGFRQWIDELYRTRSLASHLMELPLFAKLDDAALEHIIAETHFETYGEFEWFSAFRRQITEDDAQHAMESEPTIAEEGGYADGLLLVRSGFCRVSERRAFGQRTVHIAMKNDEFGLSAIYGHWQRNEPLVYRQTLTAIGYVDILRVPTALVERYVLPGLSEEYSQKKGKTDRIGATQPKNNVTRSIAEHEIQHIRFVVSAATSPKSTQHEGWEQPVDSDLLNFLVDRRIVNGTATMMIDTTRCVGCDDCVRACAAAHDNNPRFVRHGPEHGALMIANACMHCQDPVCLIGCPTGAIHRRPGDGRVIINDLTCIGCGTCAESCPYDNIRLVEIRDRNGAFIVDDATNLPIVKATKCDLCADQLGGPACQRACPHDALVRMDMRDQTALVRWINR